MYKVMALTADIDPPTPHIFHGEALFKPFVGVAAFGDEMMKGQ